MRTFILLFLFLFNAGIISAQEIRFAHITDTHIGGSTATEDLIKVVEDINQQKDIDFVLVTGDVTEFGSGDELKEAKSILDKLKQRYYVVPGNHDSKWSESGCNDFVKTFGSEQFHFEHKGYLFIGTASGPNMRMVPGLVPHEQIVFLDSVLRVRKNPDQRIFFVNHYPLDASLSNWYKVIDLLKTGNIQATLLGHGHANKRYNFEGIPGIMGRSDLRGRNSSGGYNIATIENDTLYYAERHPGESTLKPWCKVPLGKKNFDADTTKWPRPDFSMNDQNTIVKLRWEIQEESDIGTGISISGNFALYATTRGSIVAVNKSDGNERWRFPTNGKIFSTPAIAGNRVVCASTDQYIYCLSLKNGKLLWKYRVEKPVVASPAIQNESVYIGGSDAVFRSINLKNGRLNWYYDSILNFVETRPLVQNGKIFFGSWGNCFYALDQKSGALLWKREKYSNRMLSPAAVWPVATDDKVFIVAPDQQMTALDLNDGHEIWNSKQYSCRESIGMSSDKKLVYIKNMFEGKVMAFDATASEQKLEWECDAKLGYEIAPSPISENEKLVFVPTTSGVIVAIDKVTHQVAWRYKGSNALVNMILPFGGNTVLASFLDGRVICLKF